MNDELRSPPRNEESAIKRLGEGATEILKILRTTLVMKNQQAAVGTHPDIVLRSNQEQGRPPPAAAPATPRPNGNGNGRRPIPWGPIFGLACTVLGVVTGFSWQASRADTTLSAAVKTGDETASALTLVASELKRSTAETAQILTAVATELRRLGDEIEETREESIKDSKDMAVQLAGLGSLQNSQNVLVVELQVRSEFAERERSEIQEAAVRMKWTLDHTLPKVRTLEDLVERLWLEKGLDPIETDDNGDT